eukprot:gnl/TRDRNA2_/TRDRNA2_171808_c8_seq5.p1 gnl/TRDRNA2_/TRDRNA2_171808_c8~~gnl/TRDRNA2_/TRDRNA2_171808_c8_seq5.p1  ORF type:complete len:344 (-),score=65.17 gnl/TRDRNA2_/TRDRNA2_171808_c8_seq5:10-936(-)
MLVAADASASLACSDAKENKKSAGCAAPEVPAVQADRQRQASPGGANGPGVSAASPPAKPISTASMIQKFGGNKKEEAVNGCLARIVESKKFESASAALIGACTVCMAVDIEYQGRKIGYMLQPSSYITPPDKVWPGVAEALGTIDVMFNILFLLELMLRAVVLRINAIRNPWIWFDGFLVLTGWLDMFGLLEVGLDPMIMRVVRLVRLLRLLKVLKSTKAFETLFLLVRSIQASVGALVWSFALLWLVQIVMAILLSQMLREFISNESNDFQVRQEVFNFFGTFTNAMLTMLLDVRSLEGDHGGFYR